MSAELHPGRRPPAAEPLLERETQLALLSDVFDGAARGQGGLALVEGPAGAGKSALLDRAAGIARERGVVVLWARGHELERAFGWGVARSLLEQALAGRDGVELDELLAGPAGPARAVLSAGEEGTSADRSEAGFAILHALYWLVARLAEREPLLLVVDDAHWADEPSLRFLVYLAGRLSDQPIAVLVGARAGELGEGEFLRQLAGEPGAQICALPSLGATAVAELVRRRLPDADDEFCRRCLDLTAGNPLQLRELLAATAQQGQPADAVGAGCGGGGRGSIAGALGPAAAGCAVARRAGAGARGGGVRGRRSVAPGGGADGSRRPSRRWRRQTSWCARTCCGPAIRSVSPIRWCGPRSTVTCRSASARVRIAAPRV